MKNIDKVLTDTYTFNAAANAFTAPPAYTLLTGRGNVVAMGVFLGNDNIADLANLSFSVSVNSNEKIKNASGLQFRPSTEGIPKVLQVDPEQWNEKSQVGFAFQNNSAAIIPIAIVFYYGN
ncbi:MAG: hypothetical protein ACKVOU_03665 [Cytophagales bacterium]